MIAESLFASSHELDKPRYVHLQELKNARAIGIAKEPAVKLCQLSLC
ncbi:MAG: hypothetical protein MJA29_09200 [Candidatus Omnitrophica bacterium]|nr:hypothetical protein [Candidatus Omnitrophota bacterium]